jgi:hypothetical protein
VPVVLWEITAECEATLDRYEGYPGYYRKEALKVSSVNWLEKTNNIDNATESVVAMVYIMNAGQPGRPSDYYQNTIAAGYCDFSVNQRYLSEALRRINKI